MIYYLSGLNRVKHINMSLRNIGVRKSDLNSPHFIVFTNYNTLCNSKSPIWSGYLTVLHYTNIIFIKYIFMTLIFYSIYETLLIQLNIWFSIGSRSG